MEIKGCTNIEQSKRLLEIGIPVESADMNIPFSCKNNSYIEGIPTMRPYTEVYKEVCAVLGEDEANNRVKPCWSLASLRKLLPCSLKIDKQTYLFSSHNRIDGSWIYMYAMEDTTYIQFSGNDIDVAVKMIIWLKEQNYI